MKESKCLDFVALVADTFPGWVGCEVPRDVGAATRFSYFRTLSRPYYYQNATVSQRALLDRVGELFANHAHRAELWRHVTNLKPSKRASALISDMAAVAREVCMDAMRDVIIGEGG